MKVLVRGVESESRVTLMFKLTRLDSENVKSALMDYLVKGYEPNDAALLNGVKQQNFNRALKRLNDIASIVEDIKNHDWERFKKANC
jgi:hypothetical protein